MRIHADPSRCPSCGGSLPPDPESCASCGVPLRNEVAAEVFGTLQRVDVLVGELRRQRDRAATPAPSVVEPVETHATPPKEPEHSSVEPVETPALRDGPGGPPQGPGGSLPQLNLRVSTVPGILLSIGALFLLVAAIVFLAVAWAVMPVWFRTLLLLGATGIAATFMFATSARDLRAATETLAVVTLGFGATAGVGASFAGWLGDSASLATVLVCTALTSGAAGLGVRVDSRAAEIAGGVAAFVGSLALLGFAVDSDLGLSLGAAVLAPTLAGAAYVLRDHLRWLAVSLAAVAGAVALPALVLPNLVSLADDLTFAGVWAGPGWWLVLAAGYLVAGGVATRQTTLVEAAAAAGTTLVTFVLVAPVIDEEVWRWFAVASGVTVLGSTLVDVARDRGLAWAVLAPASVAAVPVAAFTALTFVVGAGRAMPDSVFTGQTQVLTVSLDVPTPWLALLGVPLLAVWVASLSGSPMQPALERLRHRLPVLGVLALAVTTATAAAAGLDRVWLLIPLALAAVLAGVSRRDVAAQAIGAVVVLVALPSAGLTVLPAAALAGFALWLVRNDRALGDLTHDEAQRGLAGLVAPAALGLAVWSSGLTLGVEERFLGAAVLVALAVVVLTTPRPPLEASTAATGLVASGVAVLAAPIIDQELSASLHLTLAGVAAVAVAFVHADRRWYGWAGGGLLTIASWVRLDDEGVGTVEAYSVPPALALLVFGLIRLRQLPDAGTMRYLLPGLGSGLLASVLLALADPTSTRGVAVLAVALVLLLGGAALRWQAPLVVGGVVGVLVAIRLALPYAGLIPPYVLIGVVGVALLLIGVTWESQIRRAKDGVAYLSRLR